MSVLSFFHATTAKNTATAARNMGNIWLFYNVDLYVRSVKPLRSWREINTRSPKFMILAWKKYSINFSRNDRKVYRKVRNEYGEYLAVL